MKKSDLTNYIKEEIFNTLSEVSKEDVENQQDLNKALKVTADLKKQMSLEEDDDKEPTKADLKKTKGLAKAKDELVLLTREMKSLAKKYKKAEGEEKEKLVADLKEKTKLKKELEAIVNK